MASVWGIERVQACRDRHEVGGDGLTFVFAVDLREVAPPIDPFEQHGAQSGVVAEHLGYRNGGFTERAEHRSVAL